MKRIDLTNRRFGKLTVIRYDHTEHYDSFADARWLCRCDCGVEVVKSGRSMKQGTTKSCGCLVAEENRRRAKKGNGK